MYQVSYTREFNGYRRDLKRAGHKQATAAINAAILEAYTDGQITGIPRTHHGESRLPSAEKYDLGNGFRLVVQLVDGKTKARAFLFAGSHDETERWLDNHRHHRWVQSKADGTLSFVQVTYEPPLQPPPDRADLDATDAYLAEPLLRDITEAEWVALGYPPAAIAHARAVTGHHYEHDADSLLARMDALAGYEKASLFFDLLHHASNKEWRALQGRLALARGQACEVDAAPLAAAMATAVNADEIITFEDEGELNAVLASGAIADWMLFLPTQQRKVVERELSGAARLRGPSGSGKTSVLVHRARFLAKKYPGEHILLVTLTESMRKLLDRLCDDLCGLERDRITTSTMAGVVRQVHTRHPLLSQREWVLLTDAQREPLIDAATDAVIAAPGFEACRLASLGRRALRDLVVAELDYVRGRLPVADLDAYADPYRFRRRGQSMPLDGAARIPVLAGLRCYAAELEARGVRDHEAMVVEALDALRTSCPPGDYRCVLADEVQDLSQMEVSLLGAIGAGDQGPAARAPDGLFLVGDGAQSIYRKGFSLRQAGIDITGRSMVLKKSYRNTAEILRAAFSLVERYEFADDDETAIARPTVPELARRHGPKPLLVRCQSTHAEVEAVVKTVKALVAGGLPPGQVCIISPSRSIREDLQAELRKRGVEVAELRSDVDYASGRVKISTIESAKGHEFAAVFIAGLVQGHAPPSHGEEDEAREAARLYVAMTRARESLFLSYAPTPRHPALALLAAVQPHCDEAVVREGEIRRVG